MMEGRPNRRVIEVMSEDSLQRVLKWAGELGWNPGKRDALAFRAADREGFVSVSDDDGAVMAGGSCRNSGAPARKDTIYTSALQQYLLMAR